MENCREKLSILGDMIEINTYERGVSTYSIDEICSTGDKKQHSIEISKIDMDNELIMFINSNDEIVKSFLEKSVEDIFFNDTPELYKLVFSNGIEMKITPIV